MLNALNKDTTPFRNSFLTRIALFIFLACCTFILNQYYVSTAQSNIRQQNSYTSEANWLKSFDAQDALQAKSRFWKPVKAEGASALVSSRIDLLKNTGLEIRNIRQQPQSPQQKGQRLKAITYNITIAGTWQKLTQALNSFEQDNSVVITNLYLIGKSDELTADMVFRVYHL